MEEKTVELQLKTTNSQEHIETVEKALLRNVINLAGGDISDTCGNPASDDQSGTCWHDTCYSCVNDDGWNDDWDDYCLGS